MSATQGTAPASARAIRLADVVGAEVTKIRTLPATWIAFAIAVVANTLLGIVAATDVIHIAGQAGPVDITHFGMVMLAPAYAFIAIAVFAAGSEYRGGQLRLSLAAVPDRNRFLVAKLIAIAGVTVPAAAVALLPGFVIQHADAVSTGDLGMGPATVDFGRLVIAYVLLSLVGSGFGLVAKTVVAPIAVLFAMPILISTTLGGTFPNVVRLLPHEATLGFLDIPTNLATGLGRGAGLLVLTTWAALFLGAGWALVSRRDI
jgi:ABC-2 type transport system permease protein